MDGKSAQMKVHRRPSGQGPFSPLAWPSPAHLGEAAKGGYARPRPPNQGHDSTLPRPSADLPATERGWQVSFPSQAVKASPANGRQGRAAWSDSHSLCLFWGHGYPLLGSWQASGALHRESPGLERAGRKRLVSLSLDRSPQAHTASGNEAASVSASYPYQVLSL